MTNVNAISQVDLEKESASLNVLFHGAVYKLWPIVLQSAE